MTDNVVSFPTSNNDNSEKREPTYCVNCQHIRVTAEGRHDWEEFRCYSPHLARVEGTNPVTGTAMYIDVDGKDIHYYTEQQFQLCKQVNLGFCPYFEKLA